MKKINMSKNSIKHLTPENLHAQLSNFTAGMAVTKGEFSLVVDQCTLEDIEWNHMDQMHRPTIHNTYEKGIRIATGENFAISLTQWKKWPFLITVTDVYVDKGLFYQSLTLAGIIFVHSIISMEQIGNSVRLKDEWYIASHKFFKLLHKPLNKKLSQLNKRLQEEDEPVRQGRFELRKKGYTFKTDSPDYYNSNILGVNTVYPNFDDMLSFSIQCVDSNPEIRNAGKIDFIVQKTAQNTFKIWPAVCPHEGGPLMQGKFCENKISCPWHGLQFKAAEVSESNPVSSSYGFEYSLEGDHIRVKRLASVCGNKNEISNEVSCLIDEAVCD